MGVYSDGSYNVPAGLIYSFPVTCRNGEWSIVQGNCLLFFLLINQYGKPRLKKLEEYKYKPKTAPPEKAPIQNVRPSKVLTKILGN